MKDNENVGVRTEDRAETFVEGLDFYFDEGLMVLTRRYLMNRGNCCDNECRHCPYTVETASLQ
jgi:Family of unknown function (DUF5522)